MIWDHDPCPGLQREGLLSNRLGVFVDHLVRVEHCQRLYMGLCTACWVYLLREVDTLPVLFE